MDKFYLYGILLRVIAIACLCLAFVGIGWGFAAVDNHYCTCPDGLVMVDNTSMSGCIKPEELAKIEGIHWQK